MTKSEYKVYLFQLFDIRQKKLFLFDQLYISKRF